MTITTRQPTGKPPWPILLLAGTEKAGKSYACAAASASAMIGRTFWLSIGEDDPDELGALPGARFEIVEHDGTYRGIVRALQGCAAEPADKAPNLIVLDSATRLWDLLCDQAQIEANKRAATKAAKFNRQPSEDDAQITMDLWNTAKQRWGHCIDALRDHAGPSIVTARLDQTTIVNDKGDPTKDKTWKVKAEKSLPYDVGATVELPALGEAWLTGVRSLRFKPAEGGRTEYKGFTVEKLWTDLGLGEKDATAARQHTANDPEDKPAIEAEAVRAELGALCEERGWDKAAVAARFAETSGGLTVKDATAPELRELIVWLEKNWKRVQAA